MVCVLNIHQIGIQIRKDRLYGLPGCAGHTLNCCSGFPVPLLHGADPWQNQAGTGTRLPKASYRPPNDSNKARPFPPLRCISLTVRVITNHLIFSQNLHILNCCIPGIPGYSTICICSTQPFQKNNSSYSRSVMDRISLDIKHPALLYPNSPCMFSSLSKSLLCTADNIILQRSGQVL